MRREDAITCSSRILPLILLFTVLAATPLIAVDNDHPPVRVQAARTLSQQEAGGWVTTFSGQAKFTQGDVTLASDTIRLHEADRTYRVIASRPFTFTLLNTVVTADTVEMNTEPRIAQFTSNVQLQFARQGKDTDANEAMTFSADALALDYGKNQAQFSGHVSLITGKQRFTFAGIVSFDLVTGRVAYQQAIIAPL